jgi:hypothetical protein
VNGGGSGSAGKVGNSGGASGSVGNSGGASGSVGNSGGASGSVGNSGGASGSVGNSGGASGSVGNSGGANTGGAAGIGGSSAGSAGSAGMATCAPTDQNGKANWTPGASTSATQDYLRSCDIRLINNNWGSAAFGCNGSTSSYNVFVNQDGSFGWNFNRGNCDTGNTNQKPDFPEIEFGIHPFGTGVDVVSGKPLATTPNFSSTTLLPLQIKNITSASVAINNMSIVLQQAGSWDITFEFWLSQQNPVGNANPGVYSELMTFWGWQDLRWPECSATVSSGCPGPTGSGSGAMVSAGKTYKLEVQSDTWANSQWRYFQFRATDGPQKTFSGTVNVKALLDYLVNTRGYSSDYWVTRFEVGSEIDDLTQGTVTMQGITFEVNGQTRTAGK